MRDRNFLIAPQIVSVEFDIAPATNALTSLRCLIERFIGLHPWLRETYRLLSPDLAYTQKLVFESLSNLFDVIPARTASSFLDYIALIESRDPVELRDQIVQDILNYQDSTEISHPMPAAPTATILLQDFETYLAWIRAENPDEPLDTTLEAQAHKLLNDPTSLQTIVTNHLRRMWHELLQPEWQRILPMLEESVEAFREINFNSMTAYEALRAVTGRDLQSIWPGKLDGITRIVFIPSPHIGPYVSKDVDGNTLYLVFGARLPKGGTVHSSALSRSELLVRINALADDTRLRILELLTESGEMCAQDIIARLDLGQSSVSRHLSQLSATGYITERRRDVAKCYTLNPDKIEDTLHALRQFLKTDYLKTFKAQSE